MRMMTKLMQYGMIRLEESFDGRLLHDIANLAQLLERLTLDVFIVSDDDDDNIIF